MCQSLVIGRNTMGQRLDAITKGRDPRVSACIKALRRYGIYGSNAEHVASHAVQAVVMGDEEWIHETVWDSLMAKAFPLRKQTILAVHAVAVTLGLQDEMPTGTPYHVRCPDEGEGGYRRVNGG